MSTQKYLGENPSSKVEHAFSVCALVNAYMARRKLLLLASP
jgi:hypothetical protein